MGKVMEWQPIESAPKDGTWVLAWNKGMGIAIVKWMDGYFPEWNVVHDHEDDYWADYEPTHWMPLPEPPEVK